MNCPHFFLGFRNGLAVLVISLAFWLPAPFASADLIISVESKSIDADGTGFIDVSISSNLISGFSLANYSFTITNVGSPASTLEFISPQDFSENLLANYVFAPDLDHGGLDDLALTSDNFIGSDLSLSGGNVPLSNSPLLLARLDVRHVLGPSQTAAQAAGDQFLISLQNNSDTFFDSEEVMGLSINPTSFNGGLVSINGAPTAIPEPSSLALLLFAGSAWGARRICRSRPTRLAIG